MLLMENVDAILHEKNIGEFRRWIEELHTLGYTSSYKIINARDSGIPQSRRRCYMVSRKNDLRFIFPVIRKSCGLLCDFLEKNPRECILSNKAVANNEEHKQRHMKAGHGFGWNPTNGHCIANSITCKPDRPASNFIIVTGTYPFDDPEEVKIRMLTPRECWRLMGFSDEAYNKAEATGVCRTQLYKQAGNSIVVNVLEEIFKAMFIDETWEISKSLEAWL